MLERLITYQMNLIPVQLITVNNSTYEGILVAFDNVGISISQDKKESLFPWYQVKQITPATN